MSKLSHCPECGAVLGKPRSLADHRRLFGLLRAAFANWPENHPFQPVDEGHLRAWALVEARYHDVEFIPYPPECDDPAVKTLFKLAIEATSAALNRRGHAFHRVSTNGLEILSPRSINFQTLSQREFGPLREAVEEILSVALGVTAEQLLRAEAA